MFGFTLAAPPQCPNCKCEHWVVQERPRLRAFRYFGSWREKTGDVGVCAQCGYIAVLLRNGGMIGTVRPSASRAEAAAPAQPGGYGTGRAGLLDPDMVTLDPHAEL